MQKIGVIHYNLNQFDLEGFLDYAAKTGFGYVELQSPDVWGEGVDDPEAEAEKVRGMVEARGLKVSALAAQNDFVVLDEETVEYEVNRMQRICQLAKILGTNVIRSEGGRPKEEVPEEKWTDAMVGCFKRCVPFLEELDIYLAVDNHGLVTNDAYLQLEIFGRVHSKRVGANLDTMNYRWAGHDLDQIRRFYEIIAPHVYHAHIKDGNNPRPNYVGAALGEGEIDVEYAVQCLKGAGYDGVYCAEYEGEEDTAIGYAKCCQWLKTHV